MLPEDCGTPPTSAPHCLVWMSLQDNPVIIRRMIWNIILLFPMHRYQYLKRRYHRRTYSILWKLHTCITEYPFSKNNESCCVPYIIANNFCLGLSWYQMRHITEQAFGLKKVLNSGKLTNWYLCEGFITRPSSIVINATLIIALLLIFIPSYISNGYALALLSSRTQRHLSNETVRQIKDSQVNTLAFLMF